MPENDTFTPESLNIRAIFCNDSVSYKVPDYQRRYSWKNEQLEALWGDLYESFKNDNKACYFLGSIVVVKNANNVFELIDGQQRLTTLMIMVSVLSKTYPDISCPNPDNEEDDSSLIDNSTFESCLFYRKGKRRLTLQTAAEYDSDFNKIVIDSTDFSLLSYPTKAQMKSENPIFNFKYTAKFFYDKFKELSEEEVKKFVFYIFNNVKLIRIICHSVPFAIKLFQVMNDRGMPLSSSDIIKSYIMGRIEKDADPDDKQRLNTKFTANWKYIEDLVGRNDLKMDDFMIFYEYFKLKSNPKKQVIDELRVIIENSSIEIEVIIDELKSFADSLNSILTSTDPTIYSLMYIPWPTYVKTCLTSAWFVKYGVNIVNVDGSETEDTSERKELVSLMRKYFYLAYISGKTLNQIKQTSFNLLAAIVEKKPIDDIKSILNDSIVKYKMVKGTYEALQDEVFGEYWLKPLLLSVEYANREVTNTTFVQINKELHMDHILPRAFESDSNWDYINADEAKKYLNTLGNMALLHYKKNEEALNKGFEIKCNIYKGLNEDGTPNNSGTTSFNTTREVVDVHDVDGRLWNVDDIERRYETQLGRIETMLGISEDDIEADGAMATGNTTISKRARFNFDDLGIPRGSSLVWYNDPSVVAIVVDEHNVSYNGETTTVSKIARDKLGYNVNGASYFCYNEKTISKIREELESVYN